MAPEQQLPYIIAGISLGVVLVTDYILYVRSKKEKLTTYEINGTSYTVVADLPDPDQAAQILYDIEKRIDKLKAHLQSKYPSDMRTKRLLRNYNPRNMREGTPYNNEDNTSYVIDKGELIVFCLRREDNAKFHDMDILMFVVLHELSHLASKHYGHGREFRKNFRWMLRRGIEVGIYTGTDYSKNPIEYCGLHVANNPLFK